MYRFLLYRYTKMRMVGKGADGLRTFQDEVRRALTKYALLPTLFLAVIGLVLVGISWERYVVVASDESRVVAAEVIAGILRDYDGRTQTVAEMATTAGIGQLRHDAAARAELYGYLYHEVNIAHDGTLFFLLDREEKLVLGSWDYLPEGLATLGSQWGILRRLKEQPSEPQAEFIAHEALYEDDDLVIGRAICDEEGHLQGYILFLLPGRYLRSNITSPYLDFVLQDRFGNTCVRTGSSYTTGGLRKLAPEIRRTNHWLAEFRHQEYYVTQQPVADGAFTLFTVMPVSSLLQRYYLGIGIVAGVLLLMIPILLVSVRRESRARARAIAEEEARATAVSEMRRLESQFNPHFLFNTLENIKFMVKLDPQAAQRMLMDLSRILRYSIKGEERKVTLREDLSYTHSYMEIQQYRFGRRLVYDETIPKEVGDCRIPRLLFQPVLENAIRYGAAEDGSIIIRLSVSWEERPTGKVLCVKIEDQGPGLSAERLQAIREMLAEGADPALHTGIYNIHRRLQLMYGRPYGLQLECPPAGGTVVTLRLPFEKEGVSC